MVMCDQARSATDAQHTFRDGSPREINIDLNGGILIGRNIDAAGGCNGTVPTSRISITVHS